MGFASSGIIQSDSVEIFMYYSMANVILHQWSSSSLAGKLIPMMLWNDLTLSFGEKNGMDTKENEFSASAVFAEEMDYIKNWNGSSLSNLQLI